jgi:hypothetical protein
MGYYHESACQGCAECIGCRRQFQNVKIRYCDKCEDEVDELFYDDNGEEICWDCYKEQYMSKICDDMDEDRCVNCGSDAEELFSVDGDWLCEECLEEMAEKVEDDE